MAPALSAHPLIQGQIYSFSTCNPIVGQSVSQVDVLMEVLKTPFQEQPGREEVHRVANILYLDYVCR